MKCSAKIVIFNFKKNIDRWGTFRGILNSENALERVFYLNQEINQTLIWCKIYYISRILVIMYKG